MWTRYFDVETEHKKEEMVASASFSEWSLMGKPSGLYLARNDDWLRWYKTHGTGLNFHYTHKKVLLNEDAFHILRLDMDNFRHYLKTIPYFVHGKEIDWQKVRDEGFDGVHISEALIINGMGIWLKCHVQFSCYDVETLVIWASPSKQKMVWSEPITLN